MTANKDNHLLNGYIRLRSYRPLTALYMFFDDTDYYYGETEFDKAGVHFVRYTMQMSSEEYTGIDIIFCRVWRWEAKKFEQALQNLNRRMEILRPDYMRMKKQFAQEVDRREI